MPGEEVDFIHHEKLLSTEEILKIVKAFEELGVTKVKITGGEPLVRKDIIELIASIKKMAGIQEVSITTNGVLLEKMIDDLEQAGLDSINISLDTLKPAQYALMTRRNQFDIVMRGIQCAIKSSIPKVKLNCVLIKEINGDEILDLVELAHQTRVHVRFIELMPIGYAKNLTPISEDEVLDLLSKHYEGVKPFEGKLGNGPAHYYEIEGFLGKVGFISAMSHRFCSTCNRVRVTSEGYLKTCLHFKKGIDLKAHIATGNLKEAI